MKTKHALLHGLWLCSMGLFAQGNTTLSTPESSGTAGTGGTKNVHVGYSAGASVTGDSNVSVGYESQSAATSSNNSNTYMGYRSGKTSNGSQNVGVGTQAGISSTGNHNVFIGESSGSSSNGDYNIFLGANAGQSNTGDSNVSVGYYSGFSSSSNGTFLGRSAGQNATGTGNIMIGSNAGKGSTLTPSSSGNNVFVGREAGLNFAGISSSSNHGGNVVVGYQAGRDLTGEYNVLLGYQSGLALGSSVNNVLLGYRAGYDLTGSNNICIGNYAGGGTTLSGQSNKLYIDNSNSATSDTSPLIYGDFSTEQLIFNGKVGIGNSSGSFSSFPTNTIYNSYQLFVKGGILTEEVRVRTSWADYVFCPEYSLKPLSEVKDFIDQNGHLPNMPSEKQVAEEGIELGNIVKLQQEKIEELTLYLIEMQKQIEAMKATLENLQATQTNKQ